MKRIDVLPDDILLEIFDFYLDVYPRRFLKRDVEAWQWAGLVHVCRRWRSLVFGSPRRLKLRLFCSPNTPVRDTVEVWPALPLIVCGRMTGLSGTDNIITALGQSNRICQVSLNHVSWQMKKVLAAMHVPFPALTDLRLFSEAGTLPVIHDSFLDGSAPRLRYVELYGIPFPGLPNLLLSATRLVGLCLFEIPHSGYISPEAIVALLCALPSLETLSLGFQSPQSRPGQDSRRLPPSKRSVIPALKRLYFKGVSEYLEDLVTRIDTPQLDAMNTTIFNQIDFDTPQLARFINRTPTLRALDEAQVQFDHSTASVNLRCQTSKSGVYNLLIHISCSEPDWQLSSIEQLCNRSLHPLSMVEVLYICIPHRYSRLVWKTDSIENALWLQLLLPFTAVKNLYLSKEFAPDIAAALQELVGDRITEVLPSLQNIFIEGLEPSGPLQENIGRFVAARQLSDPPIAISVWNKDSNTKSM